MNLRRCKACRSRLRRGLRCKQLSANLVVLMGRHPISGTFALTVYDLNEVDFCDRDIPGIVVGGGRTYLFDVTKYQVRT